MLGAGLLLGKEFYRYVDPGLPGVLVHRVGLSYAEDIVTSVYDQVRAPHVAKHPLQLKVLALLERVLHGRRPEDPLDVPGQTMFLSRIAPELVHAPDRTVRDRRREAVLKRGGPRSVVPAEAGPADGDAAQIHVVARLKIVDAVAYRHLVVVAIVYPLPPERPPLARAVDQQARDASRHRAACHHKEELVLERVQTAEGDQDRLLLDLVRRPHKVRVEVCPVLVRYLHGLHRRRKVLSGLLRTLLQLVEDLKTTRIVPGEPELRRAVVVDRAHPAVLCRLEVPGGLDFVPSRVITLGHAQPFLVPALLVPRDHAARSLKALGDSTATLLGLSQGAAELIGHPGMLWPVMPAEGFVVRSLLLRDLVDQVFGHSAPFPKRIPKFILIYNRYRCFVPWE